MTGVLLDTCALIWIFGDQDGDVVEPGRSVIAAAADAYDLHVSAISAWEVGLLCGRERKAPLVLSAAPEIWFDNILTEPGIHYLPIQSGMAIRSSYLPRPLHDDPAERMLIATARDHNLVLATRDEKILDYATLGHVRAIAC